jgi:outer membrane protein assembly factor BamB
MFGDTAITTANAGSLRERWHYLVADSTKAGQPHRRLDASPTVVNGRVYIGSRTGMFYVFDAATGAVVWQKQLDYGSNTYCAAKGIVGTATVQPDPVTGVLTVYAPGAHYLYALNAATGAQQWKSAIGPNTTAGNGLYFNWSSPSVSGGRIYMGLGANCESHLIRGGVVSLNQHTGAVQHTYYAVPAGKVGASVWSSQAVGGTSVFATTGNPDPTGSSIDDAYSIVRLSGSTLARQDKWTVPARQADDLDFGSSPTLFSAPIGGVTTNLVAACNKNGVLYAWKRDHLASGPVWSRQVSVSGSPTALGCMTSPALDYQIHRLFVAANQTTIAGNVVPGGLRSIDPATGAVQWERGLPCMPVGSPTLNGQVVAVAMFGCPAGVTPTVELFDETTGNRLGSIPAPGNVFAQPVFANGQLFVASEDGTLTAYGP